MRLDIWTTADYNFLSSVMLLAFHYIKSSQLWHFFFVCVCVLLVPFQTVFRWYRPVYSSCVLYEGPLCWASRGLRSDFNPLERRLLQRVGAPVTSGPTTIVPSLHQRGSGRWPVWAWDVGYSCSLSPSPKGNYPTPTLLDAATGVWNNATRAKGWG